MSELKELFKFFQHKNNRFRNNKNYFHRIIKKQPYFTENFLNYIVCQFGILIITIQTEWFYGSRLLHAIQFLLCYTFVRYRGQRQHNMWTIKLLYYSMHLMYQVSGRNSIYIYYIILYLPYFFASQKWAERLSGNKWKILLIQKMNSEIDCCLDCTLILYKRCLSFVNRLKKPFYNCL